MFKILALSILFTLLSLGDGPILQTGQVKSYYGDGNEVTDGSVKDDGYYQAGKTRSYSRSTAGVVTDHTTGLEWQDDVDSVDRNWTEAQNYCADLPLDGGEWRLPSIEELETLVDFSKYNPSVTKRVFSHISSSDYWSSTTHAISSSDAWYVAFGTGYSRYHGKTTDHYMRCVRGGQLESSNLSRNDNNSIVSDVTTGLQWQDDTAVTTSTKTWSEAIDYCENNLTLGGHDDWRLPNANEMLSIADRSRYPAIDTTVFDNVSSSYYFSSTSYAYYSSLDAASSLRFLNARLYPLTKTSNVLVRCVRGGQFGHFFCPDGKYLKQGERICIPGTPATNSGIYLPNCDTGRLVQGQDIESCDDTAEPVDPPGVFLPICATGRLIQGTIECNQAPEWTESEYDGTDIHDGFNDPQEILDLLGKTSDADDTLTYAYVEIVSVPAELDLWKTVNFYISNEKVYVSDLKTSNPLISGDVVIKISVSDGVNTSYTNIRILFHNI